MFLGTAHTLLHTDPLLASCSKKVVFQRKQNTSSKIYNIYIRKPRVIIVAHLWLAPQTPLKPVFCGWTIPSALICFLSLHSDLDFLRIVVAKPEQDKTQMNRNSKIEYLDIFILMAHGSRLDQYGGSVCHPVLHVAWLEKLLHWFHKS